MTEPHAAPLTVALARVERTEALDRAVASAEQVVRRIPEDVRRILRGVDWLGHPLHIALVHLPLGSFMAASAMDSAGKPEAARSLTSLGVAAALPAAAAGWSDWAELPAHQKRSGLVHAAANSLGLALYLGSIAARASGHTRFGQQLGRAGLLAVGAGAAIGAELAYHREEPA